MEIKDTYAYAKTISVIEPGGKLHTFGIEHVILGGIVSWEVNEKMAIISLDYYLTLERTEQL